MGKEGMVHPKALISKYTAAKKDKYVMNTGIIDHVSGT
jgi:hypothetical protein